MAAEWWTFEGFERWAKANGYDEDLSIDRIDNAVGYYPSNCRWADIHTQANNKTCNVELFIAGERYTLSQAAAINGIRPQTIRARLQRGWKPEDAILKLNGRQSQLLARAKS